MPDEWPPDLPPLDEFRNERGVVDWERWRAAATAAAVAAVEEIARRESATPGSPTS